MRRFHKVFPRLFYLIPLLLFLFSVQSYIEGRDMSVGVVSTIETTAGASKIATDTVKVFRSRDISHSKDQSVAWSFDSTGSINAQIHVDVSVGGLWITSVVSDISVTTTSPGIQTLSLPVSQELRLRVQNLSTSAGDELEVTKLITSDS